MIEKTNFPVCHLLGDYFEGIKKDFEKAAKVYRSNCDDYGYARSCLKYGNYTFLGKGKSSNGSVAEAYNYYEKGCSLNEPDSCLHSGLILVSRSMKQEVDRDVKKVFFLIKCVGIFNFFMSTSQGVQYLTKSCDMNNATACFYLSGLHIAGVHSDPAKEVSVELSKKADPKEFIIQKDMIKAFDYATKACHLRNMYACANLSQMYARGDGTAKNEELATKYKKLAMEMQDEMKKPQQTLNFQQ